MSDITLGLEGIDSPYVVEISEPEDPLLQSPGRSTCSLRSERDGSSKPSPKRVRFDDDTQPPIKHQKMRFRKRRSINPPPKKTRRRVVVEKAEVEMGVELEPAVTAHPAPESYEVEKILGHRIRIDTGLPEFLLKWKGYPDSENSWEPPSNMEGCSKMLYKYVVESVLKPKANDNLEIFANLLSVRARKYWYKPPTSTLATKPGKSPSSSNQSITAESSKLPMATSGKPTTKLHTTAKHSSTSKLPNSTKLTTTAKIAAAKSSIAKYPKRGKFGKDSGGKKKPAKAGKVIKNGLVKHHQKKVYLPQPISTTAKEDTHSTGNKQKKSARKQLFKEPVSETGLFAPMTLSPSSSPQKEQENLPTAQCPPLLPYPTPESSLRSHSTESLKESTQFCNEMMSHSDSDVTKCLLSSPVSTLSPLTPDRNHFDFDQSMNDGFHLHLSPSSQSSALDSPCNGLSPRINPIHSPSSLPNSVTQRQIPRHLLHRQKLFTTPVPLPRAKRRNCLSSSVPTKAAKMSAHHSRHKKRHSLTSCELPVLNKIIKSSGRLAAAQETDRIKLSEPASEETHPPVAATERDENTVNGFSSSLVRVTRQPESAADLLYKDILLNWQYELNKQRDGTDEVIYVENTVDRVLPPQNFRYISSNRYAPGVPDPSSPEVSSSLCGCECYALGKKCGTRSATFCCPMMANAQFAYSKAGKVQVEPGTPIYECNSKCSCPPDCGNKVVQHGRKIPLCIFRTSNNRGWGVKSTDHIKAHTFVTEYVGEVITSEEAEKRGRYYDKQGATYLFDLDFDDDNSEFTIDAANEGNISHFFNHSCQPNLVVYSVWIESLDKRLPRIAFFTTRNISAGEELTFDYQMNHEQQSASSSGTGTVPSSSPSRHKKTRMRCLCNSEKCLGYYY